MTKRKNNSSRNVNTQVKTAKRRSNSSTRWLKRQLNDPYVQQSKTDGYRSRAAYKLIEMDEKYQLLKPGQIVVDLGAAPGSWSQIARDIVCASPKSKKSSSRRRPDPQGVQSTTSISPNAPSSTVDPGLRRDDGNNDNLSKGKVIAIDLLEIDPMEEVEFLQGDFTEEASINWLKENLPKGADVVLSDMAPNTTGNSSLDHLRIVALCEEVFYFAGEILKPGGSMVCKVFQGGTEQNLLKELRKQYSTVKHVKPKASRKESSELYVVATGFKGREDS